MRGQDRGGLRAGLVAAAATAVLGLPAVGLGQVIYDEDFEPPVPTSTNSAGPGGFVQVNDISGTQWQVQGGGGGPGVSLTAGVDTNGAGGGQALFANWDNSQATDFTFNQYTVYGLPGPGAGIPASMVQVSMDIFISGSETANDPIEVNIQNNSLDMTFRPTLANDAYTHVEFLLSQAANAAFWDPTMSYNLRLQHGAGGFGFDASNVVRVDNVVVSVIPEPASLGLAVAAGMLALRRRR